MSTLSRRLVLAASGATAAFGALIPYGTRAATAVETGPVTSNPELYARFVAARGGTIGTGGAGAVAIRWDHNPDSAIDKGMVDLHREYDIPLTWAHYSQQVEINKGNTHSTSWERLQDFALFDGCEVGCHSRTHLDASTDAAITAEVVTSLQELHAQLPRLMVEWFIIPGVGGTNYNGFIPTNSPDDWTDTYAGQLVLDNYAMCSGHMGSGPLHELTGVARIGLIHNSIQLLDAATVIATLEQAEAEAKGVCLMLHPNVIGSSSGMSVADYERVLAHIADRRAAGGLLSLTMSGLAVADSTSTGRDQLLTNPELASAGGWEQTGWQFGPDGATGSTDATLRQIVDLADAAAYAVGGVRELAITLRSASGAQIEVERWTDVRTHQVAAGDDWQTIREFGALPTGVESYPVGIRVVSGEVEIASITLVAA